MKLLNTDEKCMLLFFRGPSLRRRLQHPEARAILQSLGYSMDEPLQVQLDFLQKRLRMSSNFPHEIGLFLGYPPADVQGFIEHGGRNFSYCGYWKVYADEQRTKALFALYAACTEKFCRQLRAGTRIEDLLLAV
jgi:hypothetical protein